MASWAGQAILFDLDGVLVDSIEASERIWRRWGDRHGVDRGRLVATIHNGSAHDSVAALAPELDASAEAHALEAEQAADIEGVVALPGAAELIHALPPSRWAVVTGGTPVLALARMDAAGLPRPLTLLTFDDVERGKPAPDGYLAAAERLGAEPADCLVVENAPAGVAAGRSAGATVLAVLTSHPPEELADAQLTAENLGAVRLLEADPPQLETSA
ncbi:MAG TPA: HAD-IA family hydrolase [Thermoleophilaceae bacterium]|jgi:mannitol-1-/sugar-/sorbitol-6-phosphatase|nr:HAD-IA family hydrolase [Thermoleophilaceae bacterium]